MITQFSDDFWDLLEQQNCRAGIHFEFQPLLLVLRHLREKTAHGGDHLEKLAIKKLAYP